MITPNVVAKIPSNPLSKVLPQIAQNVLMGQNPFHLWIFDPASNCLYHNRPAFPYLFICIKAYFLSRNNCSSAESVFYPRQESSNCLFFIRSGCKTYNASLRIQKRPFRKTARKSLWGKGKYHLINIMPSITSFQRKNWKMNWDHWRIFI